MTSMRSSKLSLFILDLMPQFLNPNYAHLQPLSNPVEATLKLLNKHSQGLRECLSGGPSVTLAKRIFSFPKGSAKRVSLEESVQGTGQLLWLYQHLLCHLSPASRFPCKSGSFLLLLFPCACWLWWPDTL